MKNKSIILLSGGLDSLVSLALAKENYNIKLALTFDYGQKPLKYEIEASKKISEYYNIEHKIIELPFLKEVTHNAFTDDEIELPTKNLGTNESSKAVWVPNRNGLFLNIGAVFADAKQYSHIIFGANKSEGRTFSDNTIEFVSEINETFKYSTASSVKVIAPLINYDKIEIVKQALINNVPLEFVHCCYDKYEKNCGICESCKHFITALEANSAYDYIERLF